MAIQLKISHPVKNIKVLKTAVKINSKGLMVMASPQFSIGDEIILNFGQNLKLIGKIFKFSQNSEGKQGMIIEFINLSDQNKHDITQLLNGEKNKKQDAVSVENSLSPEQAALIAETKTQVTDLNTLTHLALQSPDQKANFVVSTLDEEGRENTLAPSLDQKTRIEVGMPKIEKNRKKNLWKRYLGFFIIAMAVIALVIGLNKKIEKNQLDKQHTEPVNQ